MIADFTNRVHWEALAAIGTVGALWFAVIQSSRSVRLERAQAIGTLTALIGLIEPVAQCIPIFEGDEKGMLTDEEVELAFGERPAVERAIAGIRLVSIEQVAHAGVSEWYMALPIALEEVLGALPRSKIGTVRASKINDSVRYIEEACVTFRDLRETIQYGWLGKRIYRFYRGRKYGY